MARHPIRLGRVPWVIVLAGIHFARRALPTAPSLRDHAAAGSEPSNPGGRPRNFTGRGIAR